MKLQQVASLVLPLWWCIPSVVLSAPSSEGPAGYSVAKHILPLYPPSNRALGRFEANVTVGTETIRAVVDTGSADTWFLGKQAKCLAPGTLRPAACGYHGPRFAPNPSTFQHKLDAHLNITYGSGEVVNGPFGHNNMTIAGLTVPEQQFSAANLIVGTYDGLASGLLGFAYPDETFAYSGINASQDVVCSDIVGTNNTGCNTKHYPPIITSLFQQHLVEPVFSIALSRSNVSGGLISFGGTPDLHDPHVNATHGTSATTPIEKISGAKSLLYYTTTVSNIHYPGSAGTKQSSSQFIIDTGNNIMVVPRAQAVAINALFQPPAVYLPALDGWTVECNATAPSQIGVELGGQIFYINPRDLIVSAGEESATTGVCISGVTAKGALGPGFPGVLGAVFLKNVLAVCDVGKRKMTFVSRTYYQD